MRRLPAVPVYLGLELVGSLAFMATFTVTNVYYVTAVGMSPLELVLCGTAMELAIFVFEVPTGIVADTVSRRLSVIVSYVILGVATILFGALASAPLIIAAYALWGVGYTFQSGAYEAWIADEVGTERLTRVLLRGSQAGWVGALAGVGVSVVVASVDLRAAIVSGGATLLAIAVALALVMPETGFTRGSQEDGDAGPRSFLATARSGARLVRGHRLLLLMVAITFFYGLWTESIDRLWQAQLLTEVGLPHVGGLSDVVWIGLVTGATMVIGIAVNQLAVTRLGEASRARLARVLLCLNAVLVPAALLFALVTSPALAIAAYLLLWACRGLVDPLRSAWLNRTIEDSSVRATVLSMVNQSDAVGQVAGGPAIGAVGSAVGLRPALALGAAALAPALALYGRAVRHHGTEPELAALSLPGQADA
jgi:DHA3 family tetracycline resistance protein-like MFS transporter